MNKYFALQGNVGLGKAISYFTSNKITICLPLNDTQKYDLVADIDGKLCKISVKTSKNKKKSGGYEVGLRNTGGSSGKCITRKFNKSDCDYVFVLTGDNKTYLIPSSVINNVTCIVVGATSYCEYEVTEKNFDEFE